MSHYEQYTSKDLQAVFEHAAAFPFAMICKNAPRVPDIISVPVLVQADGAVAEFHMARGNPAFENFAQGGFARAMFNGPSAHISPSWYGGDPAMTAPTFNYVQAEISGAVKPMNDEELLEHLQRLSGHFEGEAGWQFDKIKPEILERFSKMIAGFIIDIFDASAIFKLSQDKSAEDQVRIIKELKERGLPLDAVMAEQMEQRL